MNNRKEIEMEENVKGGGWRTSAIVLAILFVVTAVFSVMSAVESVERDKELAVVTSERDVLEDEYNSLLDDHTDLVEKYNLLSQQYDEVSSDLTTFEGLICSYTWEDALDYVGIFPLDGAFTNPLWDQYIFFTQYQFGGSWNTALDSSTFLWDVDGTYSMVLDTEGDCIVVNPEYLESLYP